jgi:Mrp family chromosome partitioning ATPase
VHGPFGEFFSIHAGTPGPTELMSSERMSRFLIEARSRYDFVLIDSASFPLVADALALAPLADAVLSVVRLDHTPRELAAEHVERMAAVARRYGVVVNGASSMKRYGYGTAYPRTPKRSIFSLWMRRRGARDAG